MTHDRLSQEEISDSHPLHFATNEISADITEKQERHLAHET